MFVCFRLVGSLGVSPTTSVIQENPPFIRTKRVFDNSLSVVSDPWLPFQPCCLTCHPRSPGRHSQGTVWWFHSPSGLEGAAQFFERGQHHTKRIKKPKTTCWTVFLFSFSDFSFFGLTPGLTIHVFWLKSIFFDVSLFGLTRNLPRILFMESKFIRTMLSRDVFLAPKHFIPWFGFGWTFRGTFPFGFKRKGSNPQTNPNHRLKGSWPMPKRTWGGTGEPGHRSQGPSFLPFYR